MVESLNFTAYMHHKPPTKALIAKQDNYSPKEIRQVQFISHFTFDIRYIKGQENEVADALPRTTTNVLTPIRTDCHGLAKLRETNGELGNLRFDDMTSLIFEDVHLGSAKAICDTSAGRPRPFILKPPRQKVFESMHSI